MNIYEKLNAARLFFQNAGVKMSGYNSFANYKYYELTDILPVINRAAKEIGFSCIVRFGKEEATLEVVDCAKPEDRVVFTSPMSTASLKGCHEVQNLGAVESYVRRYLYLTAFEVVESDALDATQGKRAPTGKTVAAARQAAQAQGVDAQRLSPPEQKDGDAGMEMKRILEEERHSTGEALFTDADKKHYRELVRTRGYAAALSSLQSDLLARRDKLKESTPQTKFDRLLESTYPDGSSVYSQESKTYWRALVQKNGLDSTLRMLENDLKVKRATTPC